MKAYRGAFLSVCVAASLVSLGGCGNSLTDGSDPSGSVLRVTSVAPDPSTAFQPDLYVSICEVDDGDNVTYESGLTPSYANVSILNDKRPNTPTGQDGNSFVTMSRYRVDFVGINKTVDISSIDGGGQTVGIQPGQVGTMRVLLMDFAHLEEIRGKYPSIGHTESLTLRATITMWGEDAFRARVSATAEVTLVVDEYDRC